MEQTKIAVGATVEYADEPKWGTGMVLDTTDRKARVKFEGNDEPQSIWKKDLTIVKGATKTAAAKAEKIAKPKAPRAPKALGVVPLIRQDGKESKSIVAGADLSHYVMHPESRTPSGRPTLDINDQVASLLRGKDVDEVIKITAHELSRITGETITQSSIRAKYEKLNPGQIRMNCGNRLRAAFKADAGT